MEPPILITSETPDIDTVLAGIVHLHASCITHDHTPATFLPPLSFETMLQWWKQQLAQVGRRERQIVVQLAPVHSRTDQLHSPFETLSSTSTSVKTITSTTTENSPSDLEVAGIVSLHMPAIQTAPFRGVVEKLLASPNHRRKGIARRVMAKLEDAARKDGKWGFMLDTTVGTGAELVYPRLGYKRLGVIEDFEISPEDGRLVDEVWFWKDLRKSEPLLL